MDRLKNPLVTRYFLGKDFGRNESGTSDVLRKLLEVKVFWLISDLIPIFTYHWLILDLIPKKLALGDFTSVCSISWNSDLQPFGIGFL